MQQDLKLLEDLGYNSKDKATLLLKDLIAEVNGLMNEYDKKEIEDLINNKNSFIYVELACFDYEIGLIKLNEELERIHKNRNVNKINIELYTDIFNRNIDPSIEDSIFSIANFKYEQENKTHNIVHESKKTNVEKNKILSLA